MNQILDELKEQTKEIRLLRKLMEEVFLQKDENAHKKQKVQNSLNLLKNQIMQAPAIQGNTEAQAMITEIFKMI